MRQSHDDSGARIASGHARQRACQDPAVNPGHVVRAFRIGESGTVLPLPDPDATDRQLSPGCAVVVCTHGRPDALRRFVGSLACQSPLPQLLVVDASGDDATEMMLLADPRLTRRIAATDYIRVDGPLRGLTRQRNLALEYVTSELVAFFDDDVILLPGSLDALEDALFSGGVRAEPLGGVGAVIENELTSPDSLWRLRRALGVVPTLNPGAYTSSGMSVPWRFLPRTAPTSAAGKLIEGDWLPGGAMMWRTVQAREVGFCEELDGYASGEDLDFSLRMFVFGPLAMVLDARVLHLPAAGGRPDQEAMGYLGARNLFHIHQTCRGKRSRWQTAYFMYAFAVDTLMRLLAAARPGSTRGRLAFVRGRLRFFGSTLRRMWRVNVAALSVASSTMNVVGRNGDA